MKQFVDLLHISWAFLPGASWWWSSRQRSPDWSRPRRGPSAPARDRPAGRGWSWRGQWEWGSATDRRTVRSQTWNTKWSFFSHVVVQSCLVRLKRITGAAARFVSKVKPSRTERQTSLVVLPPPPPTSAKTEPSDISRTSAPLTVLNWTVITRSTTDDGKTRWKEGLGTNYVWAGRMENN